MEEQRHSFSQSEEYNKQPEHLIVSSSVSSQDINDDTTELNDLNDKNNDLTKITTPNSDKLEEETLQTKIEIENNNISNSNAENNDVKKINNIPKDYFNIIYYILFLQGIGELFSWNAIINAVDYLLYLYGNKMILYVSSVYSIFTLITILFLIKFGIKIKPIYKIIIPYIFTIFVLILIPLIYFLVNNRNIERILILFFVGIIAIASGSIQSTLYGLCSKFKEEKYMQGMIAGSAFAGLSLSLSRIITKVIVERDYYKVKVPFRVLLNSTIFYFSFCIFIILLCVLTFVYFINSKFVIYNMECNDCKVVNDSCNNLQSNNLNVDEKLNSENNNLQNSLQNNVTDNFTNNEPLQNDGKDVTSIKYILLNIFKPIWLHCFCIFFNYFITITIYPGLASTLPSYYKGTIMEDYLPIFINLTYNLFDFISRIASKWIIVRNMKFLTIFVILRIILFILFIFCFYFLKIDYFPLFFTFLLALSNGWINCMIMMIGPQHVKLQSEKEIAATILTFFLLLGITVGSNHGLLIGLIIIPN
ncbi:hypothetical protein ABK040_004905 [Willaertia magna]